jgi:RNA polymerase sigma factor (TIGR02999 family)
MTDVTRIINAIEDGDEGAAEELLPLVYEELRLLAAQKMCEEKPGQTLQATALVHEAYIRLVDGGGQDWNSRGHFFMAAAEAMRRILVENARRKKSLKRGGDRQRVDLSEEIAGSEGNLLCEDLLALDVALEKFSQQDSNKAELVKLRFFAGLTNEQSARILGLSTATAKRYWAFARAWLLQEIG